MHIVIKTVDMDGYKRMNSIFEGDEISANFIKMKMDRENKKADIKDTTFKVIRRLL